MNKYRIMFDYSSFAVEVYAWSEEAALKGAKLLYPHLYGYTMQIEEAE